MKSRIVLVIGALAAMGAGCASHSYTYTPPPAGETTVTTTATENRSGMDQPPPPQNISDQDLVVSVRHQFDRYGTLSGDLPNINIAANDGTVTLTGTVPALRDKQMIDAMVRDTPGVVNVDDDLTVTGMEEGGAPPGPVAEQAGAGYSGSFNLHVQGFSPADRALGQQILSHLNPGESIGAPIAKINIYVSDGQVTVKGLVSSEEQRQAIVEAVERAAGVARLDDDLDIRRPMQ